MMGVSAGRVGENTFMFSSQASLPSSPLASSLSPPSFLSPPPSVHISLLPTSPLSPPSLCPSLSSPSLSPLSLCFCCLLHYLLLDLSHFHSIAYIFISALCVCVCVYPVCECGVCVCVCVSPMCVCVCAVSCV